MRSKYKIPKGANSSGEQTLSLKNRKTTILNSQSIRMLQTHVNNDIYNKYCLIHNTHLMFLGISTSNAMEEHYRKGTLCGRTNNDRLWTLIFALFCNSNKKIDKYRCVWVAEIKICLKKSSDDVRSD